jgi:release factor glutamine methyltransferase
MNEKITIRQAVQQATKTFDLHNISSSQLNAELLVTDVCNMSKLDLLIHKERILSNAEHDKLNQLVTARTKHFPLQYLIGNVPFHNVSIRVSDAALIPRPETEMLVDIICKQHSNDETLRILDICTGSGCIGLSLAKYFNNAHIDGIDISDSCLSLANENKRLLGIENANFMQIDILNSETLALDAYDIVVCNPPYIPAEDYEQLEAELYYEPKIALTDNSDGLTFYKAILQHVEQLLRPQGVLYFECGIGQAKQICDIYSAYKCHTMQDFDGIDRYIIISKS